MMKRFAIPCVILTAVLATGCAGTGDCVSHDQSTDDVLFVAHRGASQDAPENTLAAFSLAWERDADLIEGDFYLSRDGRIVCHHDETTKKTAGLDVPVAEQTLEELQQLDVGAWKAEKWRGERIPTLQDVMAIVPPGKGILIEIKCGPEIVPILAEVVEAGPLEPEQMTVICFDDAVIAAVKEQMPGMTAYWLSSFDGDSVIGWTPTASEIVQTARRIGADGVDLKAEMGVLDESFVRMIREAGLELHVWTVNDPAVARCLILLGVDSITTDRPAWLREQVDSSSE